MQVVIPMAGFGERFRRAGYTVPKPLVQVEGRPMIAHVVDLFPGADRVLFLCSQEHLDTPAWRMRELLLSLHPNAEVVGVPEHRRGPVYTLLAGIAHVDLDADVLVSVCDLNFAWDFAHFRRWVAESGADGCVVAYRGFHPHFLTSVHYAFLRHEGAWATDIQEKSAFTSDPVGNEEFCSNGVYWFRTGHMMRSWCEVVADDPSLAIAGEHYVSQPYQPMIAAGLDVAIYEIQHYLQWGNPVDLEEYLYHRRGFEQLVAARAPAPRLPGTLLVPMAGLGQRFQDAGYSTPKPLIEVSGLPMVVQATRDLPRMERTVFVLRRDMPGLEAVREALDEAVPGNTQVLLDGPTDGQARTCVIGLGEAGVDLAAPLVIGACDNGIHYDAAAHAALLQQAGALVWGMSGHPGAARHPRMYGWIRAEGDRVRGLSVKVPLGDPASDPAVVGAFSFRAAGDFVAACDRMFAREGRVRGEYYVDTALEDYLALGGDLRLFPTSHYYGWGTPDDLRTFEYWQSHFHKWPEHPYRLDRDPHVPPERVAALAERYRTRLPPPLTPRRARPTQPE